MPLVKVKEKFQVTIPASVRSQLQLGVGDFLDVSVLEDGIMLKPKVVMDRKGVVEELRKVFAKASGKSPLKGKSDNEIMEETLKIIQESRKETK